MPFRDLLKKKDKHKEEVTREPDSRETPPPEFTFLRSDTHTQEVVTLPDEPNEPLSPNETRGRLGLFSGRSRSTSNTSSVSKSSEKSKSKETPERPRRISQRLGLKRDDSSINIPQNLPEITDAQEGSQDAWEQRATILAGENAKNRSRPGTPVGEDVPNLGSLNFEETNTRPTDARHVVSSQRTDDNIQEAIRLHEAGQLEKATAMFGRLADPHGENNALSQVLYGLALR
jgi:hypothetical protein